MHSTYSPEYLLVDRKHGSCRRNATDQTDSRVDHFEQNHVIPSLEIVGMALVFQSILWR